MFNFNKRKVLKIIITRFKDYTKASLDVDVKKLVVVYDKKDGCIIRMIDSNDYSDTLRYSDKEEFKYKIYSFTKKELRKGLIKYANKTK